MAQTVAEIAAECREMNVGETRKFEVVVSAGKFAAANVILELGAAGTDFIIDNDQGKIVAERVRRL
jgi:hypothetical protein